MPCCNKPKPHREAKGRCSGWQPQLNLASKSSQPRHPMCKSSLQMIPASCLLSHPSLIQVFPPEALNVVEHRQDISMDPCWIPDPQNLGAQQNCVILHQQVLRWFVLWQLKTRPQVQQYPGLYRLTVSPPKIHMLDPNTHCDGIRTWGIWEVIRSSEQSLMKETPEGFLIPSTM